MCANMEMRKDFWVVAMLDEVDYFVQGFDDKDEAKKDAVARNYAAMEMKLQTRYGIRFE